MIMNDNSMLILEVYISWELFILVIEDHSVESGLSAAAAAGWFCHAERRRYTPAYIGVRRAFSDFKIILSSFEDISVTDSD